MFDFINNDIPDELKTLFILNALIRKKPSISVLIKKCSENMQKIYSQVPNERPPPFIFFEKKSDPPSPSPPPLLLGPPAYQFLDFQVSLQKKLNSVKRTLVF